MRTIVLMTVLLWMSVTCPSIAQVVTPEQAGLAARAWLDAKDNGEQYIPEYHHAIVAGNGKIMAHCFTFEPQGYIVMGGDMMFPPVMAYSFISAPDGQAVINPLYGILVDDLTLRYPYLVEDAGGRASMNRQHWQRLLEGRPDNKGFEQWPPPGSTSTGGWLETNWSQSAPYNSLCPLDEVTGMRSVAGCPAIALAMIIHYQKNLNGTTFSDEDDYYHNYSGRQYWIDDDHHEMDFPSFPLLNVYFTSIAEKYAAFIPLETEETAALIFACGVAARQVYTSSVSGTFGVDQAYDAYLRFGYGDAMLVYDSDTSFYTHLRNNMKDGIPAHLAVLSSTGQGGHNVVTDGYNTDDFYHLNFGWGGSYNGWYLLPEGIPYNLTIVEGAIMDIGISHVGMNEPATAGSFHLDIYPNPSTGMINISFSMNAPDNVCLSVHGSDGRYTGTLFSGTLGAGQHRMQRDEGLPPGLYHITIRNRYTTESKPFVIKR
jgi:hypothetical protein